MRLPRRPLVGNRGYDILAHKRAIARGKGHSRWRKLMDQAPHVRDKWLNGNEIEVEGLRKQLGLPPQRGFDQDLFDRIWGLGWYLAYEQKLIEQAQRKVPSIGPLYAGAVNLIDNAPTHATSGIPLYPAFDTAFTANMTIIAPENITVWFKDTSAYPGEAIYAYGDSGLKYWFGHLDRDWPLGVKINRGAVIGRVLPTTIGGGSHLHVGVNAEAFLGPGKQLKWGRDGNGPNYTWGAATIRQQLATALL